jgi:hypothetical protein
MHRLLTLGICALALLAVSVRAQQPPAGILPGTSPKAFATILGIAVDASNNRLPDRELRLRDARRGHVVARTVTDREGSFAYRLIDPGSYVVELLGRDQRVLAASRLLSLNGGQEASVVVKLPSQSASGVLGYSLPHAAAMISAAAATGVLTAAATTEVSPEAPSRGR